MTPHDMDPASNQPEPSQSAEPIRERRSYPRHSVDARAGLLLTHGGIAITGRIINLGRGGCRFQADRYVPMTIRTPVEAEFHIQGLAFRLAGVTQSIYDRNTFGIRFLDMTERRSQQLSELIQELAAG